MRLSDFIRKDTEAILAEWEAFAATLLPAAAGLSSLALRDHAPQILEAVARDLDANPSRDERRLRHQGGDPRPADAPETAAQTHAVLRARGGFDIVQLVGEYRALRASVLRRWTDAAPPAASGLDDVIRFNEAIDQAVADSVGHFHAQVEQSRNLLLGMLGHDMRSPLNTILATASYLAALNAGDQVSVAAGRLIRSGASMQALLDDLLDFNRTTLGLGLRIVAADADLAAIVADEVEQARGAHPHRRIELEADGEPRAWCDGLRLQQLLRNLLSNALRYGAPGAPVRVAMHGGPDEVCLEVTTRGPAIDPSAVGPLFDPLRRGPATADGDDAYAGLGLGLFIVREIARAHGGDVRVDSGEGRTTFVVRLPRRPAASPA